MKIKSHLIRVQDKKIFKVKFLSHWSSIISDDGEVDTIKLLNEHTHEYVSMSKGHSYILQD
jgi:hypothetical protein